MATFRSDLRLGEIVVAVVVATLGVACSGSSETGAPAKPNVLLVTLDTLRADHLGCYGALESATPTLDRLAAEGVRFDQAISPVPLTLPSHATMLTGLLPLHHGVRHNGAGALPEDRSLIQSSFSAAGYRTAAFVGAFVLDRRFGLDRGFDVYDDEIPRDPASDTHLEAERSAGVVVDRAIEWLQRDDARPYFAWVHLFDAHAPYLPPEPFRSRYPGDLYKGEVAYVDSQLGRLLDMLGPCLADTIVIVAGDHGEALGEHGEMTHGVLLYEATLRVPLIISEPGVAPGGRVVASPVGLADLAPTILSLAGLSTDSFKSDGSDLSVALAGSEVSGERFIYSETEYPTLFGWTSLAAMRQGHWKVIEGSRHELFDLASDPREAASLVEAERRRYRALADPLATLRGTAVDVTAGPVDEETRRSLESLGYVGAVSGTNGEASADPRDQVGLFVEFERANQLMAEGRPVEAIGLLERLVDEDERNPVFRGTLARAFREAGRFEDAVEVYRETVALSPDDSESWYNLAVTYRDMGRMDEASIAIEQSLRRNDDNAEAHNVLGIIHSFRGDTTRAIDEFRRVVELDSRSARGFNNLGNALRETGRLDEAIAQYREALEIAPDYADPCNGIGTIEVQRGQPAEALVWFDRAVALAPDLMESRLNRAIALELAGRPAEAIEAYREVLVLTEGKAEFEGQRKAASGLLQRLEDGGRRSSSGRP